MPTETNKGMKLFAVGGWVAIAGALGIVACSSNSDEGEPGTADAGIDTGPSRSEDGGADTGTQPDAADAARPPPVFLAPSTYQDLITIDPQFPFDVTQKHAADGEIGGSRWGRHSGPMVSTGMYGSGEPPKVIHWAIPADPTGAATRTERVFAIASGLPKAHFYGADGMVDLPFGPFALLSYSGQGAAFPGEALLYSGAYDNVASRAKTNGFYSGTGIADGTRQLLVYSGLSPLSTTDSTTSDNGLYTAEVCSGALAAPAPCPASKKVFGWTGSSGPVAADAHGNVFVGASVTEDGATSDAVYGVSKTQAFGGAAVTAATVAELNSGGTGSLAALAPEGTSEGWVLGIGYADDAAVYAGAYTDGATVAKGTKLVEKAISKAAGAEAISVFNDAEGDLWLAVTTADSGFYLELRRKTP